MAGRVLLVEPLVTDIEAWFAELDRFADTPFPEDGRRQPPVPCGEDNEACGGVGHDGGGRADSRAG